jgi:hypothetical protein
LKIRCGFDELFDRPHTRTITMTAVQLIEIEINTRNALAEHSLIQQLDECHDELNDLGFGRHEPVVDYTWGCQVKWLERHAKLASAICAAGKQVSEIPHVDRFMEIRHSIECALE